MNGAGWLIAAAVLGLAELALPGLFLAFFAIAAAITGVLALALPGLGILGGAVSFVAWSVAAVLVGRRRYRDNPVPTADPLLNDRAARLIGQQVTVETAIRNGHGRVRVGDGGWPAIGPDADRGAAMRVVGVSAGALEVVPPPDRG